MTERKEAFTCRRCGHCCRGEGGIVLTQKDRERLRLHLNMSLDAFLETWTLRKGEKYHLKNREDGYCVFFEEGCSVHPARPDICRAWPFFKGNLIDQLSWEMIQDYCPGVAPEAGHEEFVRQGMRYLRENGLCRERDGESPEALTL